MDKLAISVGVLLDATVYLSQCFSLIFSDPLLLEVSLHYIVLHCSILSSTCLPSSLVFEFMFLPSQLFDFLGVKVHCSEVFST